MGGGGGRGGKEGFFLGLLRWFNEVSHDMGKSIKGCKKRPGGLPGGRGGKWGERKGEGGCVAGMLQGCQGQVRARGRGKQGKQRQAFSVG